MTDKKIDAAARAYVEAATTLADALLEKLQGESPELVAKVAHALHSGERMQLAMEFDDKDPRIVWMTLDDYGHAKRVMTIPGRMPGMH